MKKFRLPLTLLLLLEATVTVGHSQDGYLAGWIDLDGQIIVEKIGGVEPKQLAGIEFRSRGSYLVPRESEVTPAPFTIQLANFPQQITFGRLDPADFGGSWESDVSYDFTRAISNADPCADLSLTGGSLTTRRTSFCSLTGDANFDGRVSFTDFLVLSENFGQSRKAWPEGDFDWDRSVGFTDFLALSANFGQAIPELGSAGPLRRQPEGLAPGEEYRLAFVTSTTTNATSSDVQTYNDFVQQTADAAPVVGEWNLKWKAIATTSEVDARDNTRTNPAVESDPDVPIYLLDGTLLVSSNDLLWGGDFSFPSEELRFDLTELGSRLIENTPDQDGRFVWTGTDQWGAEPPRDLSLGSGDSAKVGQANDAPLAWFDGMFSQRLELEYPMYAISEVLTADTVVAAIPEPNGSVLAFLGAFYLILRLRQQEEVS